MPTDKDSNGKLCAPKPRDGGQLGRKAPTAVRVKHPVPVDLKKVLMSLPDEVLIVILGLLDWHHRMNMQSVCRRLKELVSDGPWLRRARFTLNDLPTVFTTVMLQLRPEAISELDVSHYVLANSQRLAEGISLCKNLVVLRCVHTRLLPSILFRLLRDNLPRLESLYWSLLEEPLDAFPLPTDGAEELQQCKCSAVPATLTRMYVEAISEPASIEFVENALQHCHRLRFLHFHERDGTVSEVARRILAAYGVGTRKNFHEITFTSEYLPNYEKLHAYLSAVKGNLLTDFSGCVEVYKNVTLKLSNGPSFNCITLAELDSTTGIKSHKQLTVFIAELGKETISRLIKATRGRTCRHLKALTLISLLDTGSCVALTELNLTRFHFTEDFNCCSVIATGGLDNLRSLALVACALCNPTGLQLLSQAPFKLRELDIRSTLNQPGAKVECDVCERQSTCDDTSLASLRLLRHLTRLTLYELDHTRTLDFLVGCGSLQELRLRNMGMWLPGCHQDMSPIADFWMQLRTLVLQSFFDPIDFTFLNNVPVASNLTH
ncbi:hypothetical protein V5799_000190, partial [Amblyomma americanum]